MNREVFGPMTINGIHASEVDWKNGWVGDVPHFHHSADGMSHFKEHYVCQPTHEETNQCKARFQCPVCNNPNTIAMHQDVNATVWCPAGHIVHLGDGVNIVLNGF